jgi:hypothetical protein
VQGLKHLKKAMDLGKYWPKCERLGEAIQMLNENGEGIAFEKNVTPMVELINGEQADVLLPLLCGEDGMFTSKGEKIARAFKFNNLGEIKISDYSKILEVAS